MIEDKTLKTIIKTEFGSVTNAAQILGLTRKSVQKFIDADKITTRAKNTIIAAGYDPVTFKSTEN